MLISEYDVARCYGGPEEGGWWYDDFQPTGRIVTVVHDEDLACWTAQTLTERAARLKDGPDRSSVIGTPDIVYVAEDTFGEYRTAERPVYE